MQCPAPLCHALLKIIATEEGIWLRCTSRRKLGSRHSRRAVRSWQAGCVPHSCCLMASAGPCTACPEVQPSARTPQERYRDAYPLAVELTGKLGLSGFRLNLSVEAATSYEELAAVAPKIKDAVGASAYAPLEQALFA